MDQEALDRLRQHYDSTDQSIELDGAAFQAGGDDLLVSTSIRLPRSLMDAVRARAVTAGVPTTTLMRQWITDRLDESAEQVVSVSDLQRLIETQAHPAAR